MTKTNVQPIPSNSQHHDTPNNKTHVIKFRVTAEEKTSPLFPLCLPSAARWAAISTSLQGTSIPAVRTSSRSGRNSLTNLQT